MHVFEQPLHLLAGECALCQIMYSLAGLFWRNDLGCASVIPSEQTASSYIILYLLLLKSLKWFLSSAMFLQIFNALKSSQFPENALKHVLSSLFDYWQYFVGGNAALMAQTMVESSPNSKVSQIVPVSLVAILCVCLSTQSVIHCTVSKEWDMVL